MHFVLLMHFMLFVLLVHFALAEQAAQYAAQFALEARLTLAKCAFMKLMKFLLEF